eukprot:2766388-Prymnesium_polylepis.1
MRLGLRLGRKIDANGGSVSFEFAPDCRDPASPWFMRVGDYDTSGQFPLEAQPEFIQYVEDTGSVIIVRPLCGANSPYRAFRALCLNRRAAAEAHELYAMRCCGKRQHVHMVGWASCGRTHGEIAE